ncbi:protein FAM177A1-like isoform X2 [Dunckerocampus dactyliophorus]|uniref:protein FAM177A1-like isoform X2 n=1 Tax=Dunckerocampus dactyliophorus TaxID=161453 RepID=UPI0024070381|nr:protein FAM177A1-like isoform X2 [Dunckerocampus dactyliophorus]
MGDVSLHLTNVSVEQCSPNPTPSRDFESMKLGDKQREKTPRRIIHFSSGETMEEYSTDEEEEEGKEPERKDLLSSPVDAVRSKMTWAPYFWFYMWRAATSTISACDYLGERMASFFGITSAKYQYAIDEYYRIKKQREEENEETRLSEEAEHTFDQSHAQEGDEPITGTEHAVAPPDVTYQIQNEHQNMHGGYYSGVGAVFCVAGNSREWRWRDVTHAETATTARERKGPKENDRSCQRI